METTKVSEVPPSDRGMKTEHYKIKEELETLKEGQTLKVTDTREPHKIKLTILSVTRRLKPTKFKIEVRKDAVYVTKTKDEEALLSPGIPEEEDKEPMEDKNPAL